MKSAIAAILILSVAAPTAVSARGVPRHGHWAQAATTHSPRHHDRVNTATSPRHARAARIETNLTAALNAMVSESTVPPGQTKRPFDPDRGDDNASARAIFLVCNMHRPAARRSAICPSPVSPD